MKKTKLDWNKVGKKFLIVAAEIAVLGGISYITGKPEFMYLMPILEAARNYLKHK